MCVCVFLEIVHISIRFSLVKFAKKPYAENYQLYYCGYGFCRHRTDTLKHVLGISWRTFGDIF